MSAYRWRHRGLVGFSVQWPPSCRYFQALAGGTAQLRSVCVCVSGEMGVQRFLPVTHPVEAVLLLLAWRCCSVCSTTQLIPTLFWWCRSSLSTATFWRRSVVTLALWGAALPSWRVGLGPRLWRSGSEIQACCCSLHLVRPGHHVDNLRRVCACVWQKG